MRIETFIAGAILGAFLSDKKNQELVKDTFIKGAGIVTDSLNRRGEETATSDVIIDAPE